MKDKSIISAHGTTEDMNVLANDAIEKTAKEFKKEPRKNGYPMPKYIPKAFKGKDGSSEGDKTICKIASGNGYVKDFESWIKSKISKNE